MSSEQAKASDRSQEVQSAKGLDEAESNILYFLDTYKNYISQCIDYKDLLFYKYLGHKKRKEFREKAKLQDGSSVTCEMINYIISMTDIPDRFTALVDLFEEEFENEKVLRILKGEKVPCNSSKNKERIQKICMKDICENLRVPEIIPECLRYRLILPREGDHLRNKAKQETCFDAALDLLLLLPSRHANWYPRFLNCLINSGHQQLAEKVDKDLFEKIKLRKDLAILEDVSQLQLCDEDDDFADDFEDMSLVSGPMKKSNSYMELPNPEVHERKHRTHKQDISATRSGYKGRDDINLLISPKKTIVPNIQKRFDNFSSQSENIDPTNDRKSTRRSKKWSRRNESIFNWLMENDTAFSKNRPEENGFLAENRSCVVKDASTEWPRRASDISSFDIDIDLSTSRSVYEGETQSTNSQPLDTGVTEDDSCTDSNKYGHIRVYDDKSKRVCTEDVVTRYREIQRKSMEKEQRYPALSELFKKENLHPVKLSLILRQHTELLSTSHILGHISKRAMQFKDDVLALWAHYISTVIHKARDAGSIDEWIDMLLTGRAVDGCLEFQDTLIRQVVHEFSYKKSCLFERLNKKLGDSQEGDGLLSLKILIEGLNGTLFSTDRIVSCHLCEWFIEGNLARRDHASLNEIPEKEEKGVCHCFTEGNPAMESISGINMEVLKQESREYKSVEDFLQTIVNGKCLNYSVTGIKRIRNEVLYAIYQDQRKRMALENNGTPNERFLLHWSKSLRKVIVEGFHGISAEEMLKKGIYFSDDPIHFEENMYIMKSHKDHLPPANVLCGCRRLLLCRVSLGNSFSDSSSRHLTTVPKGHHSIKTRHGVNGICYSKYTVSTGEQVYSEYLVTYRTTIRDSLNITQHTDTGKSLQELRGVLV